LKYIILDTETTGTKETDRIVQLSFLVTDENNEIEEIYDTLCLPPVPISYEAMAVHHITPEKVINAPILQDTQAYKRLQELNIPENILVIHNAKFDLEMLFREDFENNMQLIDTFRVLKHIQPDDRHSLQINRYFLGLYKKEQELINKHNIQINAHDALGDVVVLKLLLDYLLEKYTKEELLKFTKEPILYEKFYNGKYKREKIVDIIKKDPAYIEYLLTTNDFELDFDLRYSLNYYLQEYELEFKFEVGKYKGLSAKEVAEVDMNYLRWAYHNMRMNKGLRKQIGKIIGVNDENI
jgi:exodeoxyribonuclease X